MYRKTIEEVYNLLMNMEGPLASADRAKLATLGKADMHLAIVRPHYDNVRANIVYARLDSRGRGRVQMAAELPLIYSTGRHHTIPEVTFPRTVVEEAELPRRKRQSELEEMPFLQTVAAYRYMQTTGK